MADPQRPVSATYGAICLIALILIGAIGIILVVT